MCLSPTVRNKESNKRFIGLRWGKIDRLLDSIFDENYFVLNKAQFEKLLVKNRKNFLFEQISIFLKCSYQDQWLEICTVDDEFVYWTVSYKINDKFRTHKFKTKIELTL